MMKMKCLAFFLLLTGFTAYAQSSDVVFSVKASKDIYQLPNIDTLLADREYKFQLNGVKLSNISKAIFTKGKVILSDSYITIRTDSAFSDNRLDSLQLYMDEKGSAKRALSKKFVVTKLPELYIVDTSRAVMSSDLVSIYWLSKNRYMLKHSEVSIMQIKAAADNNLTGRSASSVFKFYVKLGGFKMDINCNGHIDSYSSVSESLTPQMRTALGRVEKGCGIKLYDIQCLGSGPSNDIVVTGPYSIQVTE